MLLAKQIAILTLVLCLSAAVGAVLFSLFLWFYFYLQDPEMRFVLFEQLHFAGVVSIFAVPVALILGLPGFFLLRHFGLLSMWSICVLATLAGGLVGATTLTAGMPWVGCVGLGFVSGVLAWVLIVRSNIPLVRTPFGAAQWTR